MAIGTPAKSKPSPKKRLLPEIDHDVVYMCRRSDLRLVWHPRYYINNPTTGARQGITEGRTVVFRDGVFKAPPSGPVKLNDTNGSNPYKLNDARELHEWLEQHQLFGDRVDGFWRVEEPAPPASKPELEIVLNLAMDEDEDGLVQLIEEEEAGWNRQEFLDTARRTLERVREKKAAA